MNTNTIINLLATITLLEMMITIGLGIRFSQVTAVAKHAPLIVRAVIGNYVLVPLAGLGLLLAFHAQPMVAAGFLIAAVCPGAPYGPPFTGMAKGNVPVSVGLMVVLAGSSAFVAPLLLHFLLPILAGNEPIKVNVTKMVTTLLFSQFLPLCVGVGIREKRSALADKLVGPAKKLSTLLNLVLVSFIFYVQWNMLTSIPARGFLGMFLLVVATVIIGWGLGGRSAGTRRAMTAATSVRNVGVSLVIATGSFPGTPAVTAATAYALFQTILIALFVMAWGKAIPIPEESGAHA